jgi:hypothetical protein
MVSITAAECAAHGMPGVAMGLPVPPSSLTFSSPFWDDAGNVLNMNGNVYTQALDSKSRTVFTSTRSGKFLVTAANCLATGNDCENHSVFHNENVDLL